MTADKIVPVISPGGSGTRLWPMSRPEMPKQMLALTANETMLQLTAGRAFGERFAAPIVVANARHADLVEQQLSDVGAAPLTLISNPPAAIRPRRSRWPRSLQVVMATYCW